MVFLSGGGSISYAESTLGVVEGYRLGDIVGGASGDERQRQPLHATGWVHRVVDRYARDEAQRHAVGIIPTVPVSPTVSGIRAGRDEVLERAVQLVGGGALVP